MKCMSCGLDSQEGNPLMTSGAITIHEHCNGMNVALRYIDKAETMARIIKESIYFDWNRAFKFKDMHSSKAEAISSLIGDTSNDLEDFIKQCKEFTNLKQQLETIAKGIRSLENVGNSEDQAT